MTSLPQETGIVERLSVRAILGGAHHMDTDTADGVLGYCFFPDNVSVCIELVLRRRDGSFTSTSWLMGTLCHEVSTVSLCP